MCQANLVRLELAAGTFLVHSYTRFSETDVSKRYPDRLEDLVPKYLPAIPHCPTSGEDTYSESYQVVSASDKARDLGREVRIHCSGSHHKDAGLAENLPAISTSQGPVPYIPYSGDEEEIRQTCENNLESIATAIETRAGDQFGYPKSLKQLEFNYVRWSLPRCPSTHEDTYSRTYTRDKKSPLNIHGLKTFYAFSCSGNHAGGNPSYDSAEGLHPGTPFD